jgi:DNA-binding PadR family transcriptional regulator
MTVDGALSSSWDTENVKGHPRKFYSLTRDGKRLLDEMTEEFERMLNIFHELEKNKE